MLFEARKVVYIRQWARFGWEDQLYGVQDTFRRRTYKNKKKRGPGTPPGILKMNDFGHFS